MSANLLTLNSSKTEFLIICLKQQLSKTDNSSLGFIFDKCKKHSLPHQLTAQLHIENSKNKKMVITLLQHIA